ncbi:hypothetical protein CKA32_006911 [Geitlerinema sp. FC II]|nr:hypothetical protein CKA32_006911 [Geitlerinema sp. FC II]
MRLAENALNLSASLCLLVVASGAIGGAFSGEPFNLRPALAFLKGVPGFFDRASDEAIDGDTETIGEVVDGAIARTSDAASDALENIPTDPRLAACPEGSVDTSSDELTFAEAKDYRDAIADSPPASLFQVQGDLGTPSCNYTNATGTTWVYLVRGMRLIRATETPAGIEFEWIF